jgi:hypothetical protein
MVMFGTAFCFVYIAFILFLPFQVNRLAMIFMAFLGGLITDMFYDSMGMNAAASVFIAFIRKPWISLITPAGGYEEIDSPTSRSLGMSWMVMYVFPLTLFHHLVLFQIESGQVFLSWFVLKKVLASAVFTSFVLILIRSLFYRRLRTA